jgi:aryl-alcohol dehydrogenase-like predicted oxidoreductase
MDVLNTGGKETHWFRLSDRIRSMKYNRLGNSGLIVSRLGVGTVTFGTGTVAPGFVGRMDQSHADKIVSKCLDAGITLFDTADAYSGGESERVLGRALGTRRKEAIITTKVRARIDTGVLGTGLSYRQIKLAVEGSLKRLGTDWIDIYQPHLPDPVTPLEETVRALEQLVVEGKVRYIGLSNYPAWQAARFLGIQERLAFRPLVCAQMYYSLLERELENECVPFYREAGIGVQVWSPLASGFLSGKYTRDNPRPDNGRRNSFPMPPVADLERAYGIVDELRRIAEAHGATPAQIAIAWILRRDWVATVLVGAADEAQVDENIAAIDLELTDDEARRLDAMTSPSQPFPTWYVSAFQWDPDIKAALGVD